MVASLPVWDPEGPGTPIPFNAFGKLNAKARSAFALLVDQSQTRPGLPRVPGNAKADIGLTAGGGDANAIGAAQIFDRIIP